jgi:hypothetical protein
MSEPQGDLQHQKQAENGKKGGKPYIFLKFPCTGPDNNTGYSKNKDKDHQDHNGPANKIGIIPGSDGFSEKRVLIQLHRYLQIIFNSHNI